MPARHVFPSLCSPRLDFGLDMSRESILERCPSLIQLLDVLTEASILQSGVYTSPDSRLPRPRAALCFASMSCSTASFLCFSLMPCSTASLLACCHQAAPAPVCEQFVGHCCTIVDPRFLAHVLELLQLRRLQLDFAVDASRHSVDKRDPSQPNTFSRYAVLSALA